MKSLLKPSTAVALCAALSLAACATQPMGPTVNVMPATNKPFQMFQQDQFECKSYASSQIAGQVDAANNKAVGAALLGTALGAGLGAAVGGGRGAAVGAAGGSIVGTGAGADSSTNTQLTIQQQYDNAYTQCMYSKGNQVPGMVQQATGMAPPPPPPGMVPPPSNAAPPGAVPPPNAPPPPPR